MIKTLMVNGCSWTAGNELEQDVEKVGQIFGMPKSVIENIIVQVLTPYAGKIIDGFTKKD